MSGISSTDQAFINRLTGIILANLENEHFDVDKLASAARISRSALYHRLLSITGKSTTQFIREVRLQQAMEILQHKSITASEVAYQVGFSSPAYFNTCFPEYFGYTPGEVLKNRDVEPEDNCGLAASEPEAAEPVQAQKSAKKPVWNSSGRQIYIYTGIGLLIIIGIALLLNITVFKNTNSGTYSRLKSADKSISVLPFKNLSKDEESQYFAEGVAENILNNLVKIRELKVVSVNPAKEFSQNPMDIPGIANKLGVNFLLTGSVQHYGHRVQVITQLIDAKQNQHIWSDKYDKELVGIFFIESDIARQVADQLKAVLSSEEKQKLEKIPTKNTEAYNLYLMGRYFWNKRTEEGLRKSIEYFSKAVAADPDYALAYAGLADAYYIQTYWGWINRDEGVTKAKKFVLKALELDPNLSEAHATMGGLLCNGLWEWEEARKEYLIAIELNPNYATAHQYYSSFLDILGQTDEAIEEINLALNLDPLSEVMNGQKLRYCYRIGKIEEALNICKLLQEIDPHRRGNWLCFYIYLRLHNDLKAVETLQNILSEDPLTAKYAISVREIYNKSKIDGLLKWLIDSEQKKVKPGYIELAKWNAFLGNKIESMKWLEKGMEARILWIPRIYNERDFEILYDEPRFKALVEKMGLNAYQRKITVKSFPTQ